MNIFKLSLRNVNKKIHHVKIFVALKIFLELQFTIKCNLINGILLKYQLELMLKKKNDMYQYIMYI